MRLFYLPFHPQECTSLGCIWMRRSFIGDSLWVGILLLKDSFASCLVILSEKVCGEKKERDGQGWRKGNHGSCSLIGETNLTWEGKWKKKWGPLCLANTRQRKGGESPSFSCFLLLSLHPNGPLMTRINPQYGWKRMGLDWAFTVPSLSPILH